MTPQQALDYLDSVTSTINGSRQDHVNIQQAILALKSVVGVSTEPLGDTDESVIEQVAKAKKSRPQEPKES